MNKSLLVKIFGFPATLIHGDSMVLDRWLWLKKRLPRTANNEKLIDIGCGTGAFTIGAALRGYKSLGLSWDKRNQHVAEERAKLSGADLASFEIQDVRMLRERPDLFEEFDVAICCENIEHILDDRQLIIDIATCLKPGGRLLLTTPNYYYHPITSSDMGPFYKVENGGHVRRGYTEGMLRELCEQAGLIFEERSFCGGYLSQKFTFLLRTLSTFHPLLGWGLTLPLRVIPPLFDQPITKALSFPYFSICMEAYKPKYRSQAQYLI